MEQITIGTAGHIDHGKSSLVRALTGTDPDRLAAEKERGMTLDLGFAHLPLGQDAQVSFVDVPGHEDLISQMLAGAQGFSGVLFVIAADEGLMPQSLEHYQLCKFLGVTQGIVVLTKVDLVEPDLAEWLKLELTDFFAGGFLETAPVIGVSSTTGEGIEALKEQIKQSFFPPPPATGAFRLPLDRAFTLKGFGSVISGTVLQGKAQLSDPLWLYPQEEPVKARGFQVAGKETDQLSQGMRGAVNLSGLSVDQLGRGMQLAAPGSLVNTQKIGVALEPAPGFESLIKNRLPVKVYAQTGFAMGRLVSLDTPAAVGGSSYWLLRLDRPLSLRFGDRLVLRGHSPEQSLAGVRVLALTGAWNRKNRDQNLAGLAALHLGNLSERILQALRLMGPRGLLRSELGPLVGAESKTVQKEVSLGLAQRQIVELDHKTHRLMHPEAVRRWAGFIHKLLAAHHQDQPEDLGAELDFLVGKIRTLLSRADFLGVLGWSVKENLLAKTDKFYHLKDFKGGLSPAHQDLSAQIIAELAQTAPRCLGLTALAEQLEAPKAEVFGLLKRAEAKGQVVQVAKDLFYTTDDTQKIWSQLEAHLLEQRTITVIQFKELFGLARKPAILLLEHFDSKGLTLRNGDQRSLPPGACS